SIWFTAGCVYEKTFSTASLCIQIIAVIYSYRKAEETDREAIYQLYCLVMRGFISEMWGWDERWQESDFSAHFDPQGITLAQREHELVGYSQVENRGVQLFIRMIVVHPHHQRKGIGRKLLESVIASGNEQSKGIGLEVFKINSEAMKFYERFDFTVEGENPTSYVISHA
ncbi:MAG: hypothetical protein FD118_3583, partial [Rhodocyclaceae bacterium]